MNARQCQQVVLTVALLFALGLATTHAHSAIIAAGVGHPYYATTYEDPGWGCFDKQNGVVTNVCSGDKQYVVPLHYDAYGWYAFSARVYGSIYCTAWKQDGEGGMSYLTLHDSGWYYQWRYLYTSEGYGLPTDYYDTLYVSCWMSPGSIIEAVSWSKIQ
jgi:hypothetical protein